MKNSDEILKCLTPLSPIPSDIPENGNPPMDIKAILFDVYGTLLISGTGDIGIAADQQEAFGLTGLLKSLGYGENTELAARRIPGLLEEFIAERHTELRSEGVDYPEVEIRNVWQKIITTLWNEGLLDEINEDAPVEELSMGYELEVNPVWSMPGFPDIIETLSTAGFRLGIVSNAQFYTPPILEALAGKTLSEIGFEDNLCFWSYKMARAKPSPLIFSDPIRELAKADITPEQILYVGNDMLNDVTTAASVGCRTCLFAGDKRSLRLREGDSRVQIQPDMTITRLSKLKNLTGTGDINDE